MIRPSFPPDKSLKKMKTGERDDAWVKICKAIVTTLGSTKRAQNTMALSGGSQSCKPRTLTDKTVKPKTAGKKVTKKSIEKKRVLVVDDEIFFVEDATDEIRLAGFDVTGATSYTEAIQALEKQAYDVVTLDVMMVIGQDEANNLDAAILDATRAGRRTGLVLFEQIRQRWPQTNVVIVSVLGATDRRVRVLMNEGVIVLAKPVAVEELINAVKRAAK
jgi:CheY-like chemotaxis protein